jgi:hypothetical protein
MISAQPTNRVPEIQNPNSKLQNPAHRQRRAEAIDACVKLMAEKMQNPDLSVEQICKIGDTLAKFAREDNAADRAAAAVRIAELRANSVAHKSSRPGRGYSPDAPWGRKEDGTPYTEDEFRIHLRRAVHDIYGVKLKDSFFGPLPIVSDVPGSPYYSAEFAARAAVRATARRDASPAMDSAPSPIPAECRQHEPDPCVGLIVASTS